MRDWTEPDPKVEAPPGRMVTRGIEGGSVSERLYYIQPRKRPRWRPPLLPIVEVPSWAAQ